MHRFVNVVDTTAPTYTEKESKEFYAGFAYNVSDFIEYSDNYDSKVTVTPDTLSFGDYGQKTVSFELKDSSGNTTTYSKTINVKFDFVKLLEEVYKSYPSKISYNESIDYW
jgi:hypothetical protein